MINPTQQISNFQDIYAFYSDLFSHDVSEYESEQTRLILPHLPVQIINSICDAATKIFQDEPNLLVVNMDIVVVGDIHGQLLDLFRILHEMGPPPNRNYLFLGDFVDRGDFSTETITLVLILKILYPENVFIIRGNHEFSEMFTRCGFTHELVQIYTNPSVKASFQKCFSYMPLAALVNDSILCVHGGIGPQFSTLGQITDIKRPLYGYDDDVIMSIVWSDPSTRTEHYSPSTRGSGYLFGSQALLQFLKSQVLEFLVRGHECIQGGVEFQLNGNMATVFSASNYCGMLNNKSGVLLLNKDKSKQSFTFNPLTLFRRYQAIFVSSEDEFKFEIAKPKLDKLTKSSFSLQSLPVLHKLSIHQSDSSANFPKLASDRCHQYNAFSSGNRNAGPNLILPVRRKAQVNDIRQPKTTRRESVAYVATAPQAAPPPISTGRRQITINTRKSLLSKDDEIPVTSSLTCVEHTTSFQPVVPSYSRTQPCPRKLLSQSYDAPSLKPEIKMPADEPISHFPKRRYSNKASEMK